MKIFKLILTIILSMLLIASILLNIILFKSSYASLLVRYDKDMFTSLADNAAKELYPTSFLQNKQIGVELFMDFEDNNDSINYHFYVDEESKLTFKINEVKNGKTITYYLKDDVLYINDQATNSKTKSTTTTGDEFYYIAIASTKIDKLLPYIENNSNERTEIDFNSGYFLGLEYEVEVNEEISYTYHFDLKGKLRSVDVDTYNEQEYTIAIKESNNKIEMPDFSDYTNN